MTSESVRGRFVWHELTTPDSAAAHAFYKRALGWKTEQWPQDPRYLMFASRSGPLGGTVDSGDTAPQWIPYVGTDDIDATVKLAATLGAGIVRPPTSIPNGSQFATLTDPQGAPFAVYASGGAELPADVPARIGEFSWHELATTDFRRAFEFYRALFDWEIASEFDMGPMGIYLIFGRAGRQLGGMFDKGDMGRPGPGYWVGYVRVADVHATARKVRAAAGTLVHGPSEVPGGDWIAQFVDPQGALCAVHALASDVSLAKAAPAKQAKKKPVRKTKAVAKKSTKKKPAKSAAAKKSATKKTKAKTKAKKAKVKKSPARKSKKAVKKRASTGKSATKKTGKKAAKKRPAVKKKPKGRRSK